MNDEANRAKQAWWPSSPRSLIIAITAASLFLSFAISAVWFLLVPGTARFEPAVGALGLLAGITGVVAERRAASLERRELALTSVRSELQRNRQVLSHFVSAGVAVPRREIYPRLYTSAVDDTLSSMALLKRDEPLALALHAWRDSARTFNQRLTIAELLAFVNGSDEVLRELHQTLHAERGPVGEVRAELDKVLRQLPQPT
jgi:hypothetical protein